MPQAISYAASFKSEVSRLARKEAKALVGPIATDLIKAKKVISAQRKELADLQRSLNALTKVVKKQAASLEPAGAEEVESKLGEKWRKDTVRSTRRKLQITQTQMATLLGVSIGSVTGWETGRTEPRERLKEKVFQLRSLHPRDAAAQLEKA